MPYQSIGTVAGLWISVGYQTGNHYRLSEYNGRLIIDYTIENYIQFTKNSNFHKINLLHTHMQGSKLFFGPTRPVGQVV